MDSGQLRNEALERVLMWVKEHLDNGDGPSALELLNNVVDERAGECIAQGVTGPIVAYLDQCPASMRRDQVKAKVLCLEDRLDEALALLASSFYACEADPETEEAVQGIIDMLLTVTKNIRPDLHTILQGGKPEARHTADMLLKRFYFERTAGNEPLGRTAMKALTGLQRQLKRGKTPSGNDYYIQFLKTYASATPIMKSKRAQAVGGGYFLCAGGYGCVIDPGHHFLDNFFRKNHSVDDIDAVVVTHFHDDHYADLSPLLSLLYRRQRDRSVPTKKILICCDRVTARAFAAVLEGSPGYLDCREIDSRTAPLPMAADVIFRTLPTDHYVFGVRDSGIGLVFELPQRGCTLVITGDTAWTREVEESYQKLRDQTPVGIILIAHVSSVSRNEIPFTGSLPLAFHENHLCIHGLCRAIEVLRPQTVFLSEVGEELAPVVARLARLIHETYPFTECRCYQCGDKYPLYTP